MPLKPYKLDLEKYKKIGGEIGEKYKQQVEQEAAQAAALAKALEESEKKKAQLKARPLWQKAVDVVLPGEQFRTPPSVEAPKPTPPVMHFEATPGPTPHERLVSALRESVVPTTTGLAKQLAAGVVSGVQQIPGAVAAREAQKQLWEQVAPEIPAPETIPFMVKPEQIAPPPATTAESVAREIGRAVPEVAMYGMAAPLAAPVGAATRTALGRVTPRLAAGTLGRVIPQAAEMATLGAGTAALEGQPAGEIGKRTVQFATLGAAGATAGAAARTAAAKALPTAALTTRLGRGAVSAAGGLATGATMAGVDTAVKFLKDPEEFDKAEAAGDAVRTALFFAGIDTLFGLLSRPTIRTGRTVRPEEPIRPEDLLNDYEFLSGTRNPAQEGYKEWKPGSGIWLDPKTNLPVYREVVEVRPDGSKVYKLDIWRAQREAGAAARPSEAVTRGPIVERQRGGFGGLLSGEVVERPIEGISPAPVSKPPEAPDEAIRWAYDRVKQRKAQAVGQKISRVPVSAKEIADELAAAWEVSKTKGRQQFKEMVSSLLAEGLPEDIRIVETRRAADSLGWITLPDGRKIQLGLIEVKPSEPAITPEVRTVASAPIREPWQMTQEEYARNFPAPSGSYRETLENHRRAVEQALAEGKSVPEQVLADYPDLKPAAAVKEPWQMTRAEYTRFWETEYQRAYGKPPEGMEVLTPVKKHEFEVKQALAEGKPVPEEVLADYPELRRVAEAAPTAAPTAELTPVERGKVVEEAPAVKPEAPEVPETTRRKVSPKVGGTYTVRIVKSTAGLKEGQEFTGTVRRIFKAKTGAVLAEVELPDGTKKNVPVSKYAEWWSAEQPITIEARTAIQQEPTAKKPWQMTKEEFAEQGIPFEIVPSEPGEVGRGYKGAEFSEGKIYVNEDVVKGKLKRFGAPLREVVIEHEKSHGLWDSLLKEQKKQLVEEIERIPEGFESDVGKSLGERIAEILTRSKYAPQTLSAEELSWASKVKETAHRNFIQQALSESKPVPPEVLKDYPDLAAKYGKQTEVPTPETAVSAEAQKPAPEAAVPAGDEEPAGELRAYRGARATVQVTQPTANQIQKLQILRILEDRFNVPLRTGRLRIRGALGEYSTRENVIKTRVQADLPVIAHELGHRLQRLLNFDLQQLASSQEIMGLGQAVARKGAKPAKVAEEGLSEFVRLFISEPDRGQSKAPNFYAEFVNALNQQGHEEIRDALLEAWGLYQTWFGQDPVSRVAGHIVGHEAAKAKHWLTPKERYYTKLFYSGYPIFKAVQEAFGGSRIAKWRGKVGMQELPYVENPKVLYDLAQGRFRKINWFFVEGGAVSPDFTRHTPNLQKILEPVSQYINPLEKPEDKPGLFQTYLVARRAVELHGRGIATGIAPEDAEYTVRKLEREHPEFREAAERLYEFQDIVVDHLVDAGVLAQETAGKMRELNRAYVPFRRFFEEEAFSPKAGGGRKVVDLPSGVKAIRGSERMIYDSVESIIGNTMYLLDLAERNKVGRALARLANKVEGFGKLMYRVPQPIQPIRVELEQIRGVLEEAGVDPDTVDLNVIATTFVPVMRTYGKAAREGIAWIWENGKPTFWRMHPDLYQALQAFDEQTLGTIEWAVGGPPAQLVTRLLRGGAVLTPEFAGRNIVRDIGHSMTMGPFHPLNFVEGLFHVIKRDDLYERFVMSGAAQSAWLSFDRDYGTKNVREITGKLTPLQKARRIAVTPIEALRLIGETAEEATRVGAFARAEREALKKGLPEEEARARAAYTGREISVDFGRSGVISRRLNRYNVFFNAAVQGADRVWREFKANPLTFGLKGLLYITVPSVILYLMNKDDERWQRLPRYVRDLNWTIPTERGFVLIPKPFEVGVIFGTLPERLLEHFAESDPDAFDEFAKRVWDVFTPSIIPTIMAPWIEAYANRSLFTGLPIIPEREKRLAPEERYDVYTSPLSVMLGRIFNVSPRYVDSFVRGYTGGLGMHAWKFLSFLAQKAGLAEEIPLPERTETIPLVRGFYYEGRPGRGNADKFYEIYNRLEQQYYTAREKQKRGEQVTPQDLPNMVLLGYLRRVEKRFQDLRAARRMIEFDRTLTPEQKRRALDWLDQQQETLAENAVNLAERGGVR